ncbi:MAG: NAD-dependent epimerase/dehydratase family protein [Oscillospiraceae bacterium]
MPLAYYRNNLDSTLALLEKWRRRATYAIFSSSATVYGGQCHPHVETMPTYVATSPYG